MWWRVPASVYGAQKGEGNRQALQRLAETGGPVGLLAYAGEQPAGWCAVAPREAFPRLEHSRILKPVDNQPVWSVACLFIARPFRRRGLSKGLLAAALDYAREGGAQIVEGYPVEPHSDRMADTFAWTGIASTFRAAGFQEVARRAPTRPIMRFRL